MTIKIRLGKPKVKKSQKNWNLRNLTKMVKKFNIEVEIALRQHLKTVGSG